MYNSKNGYKSKKVQEFIERERYDECYEIIMK